MITQKYFVCIFSFFVVVNICAFHETDKMNLSPHLRGQKHKERHPSSSNWWNAYFTTCLIWSYFISYVLGYIILIHIIWPTSLYVICNFLLAKLQWPTVPHFLLFITVICGMSFSCLACLFAYLYINKKKAFDSLRLMLFLGKPFSVPSLLEKKKPSACLGWRSYILWALTLQFCFFLFLYATGRGA